MCEDCKSGGRFLPWFVCGGNISQHIGHAVYNNTGNETQQMEHLFQVFGRDIYCRSPIGHIFGEDGRCVFCEFIPTTPFQRDVGDV